VCRTGQIFQVNDITQNDRYTALSELPQTRTELVLPLCIGSDVIGVLAIHSDRPAHFDQEDQKVLQILANQIAMAIRYVKICS